MTAQYNATLKALPNVRDISRLAAYLKRKLFLNREVLVPQQVCYKQHQKDPILGN